MSMHALNARYSADPDGVSAQIDFTGVPWLMIGRSRDPRQNAARRAVIESCPHVRRPRPTADGRRPSSSSQAHVYSFPVPDEIVLSCRESAVGLCAIPELTCESELRRMPR